MRAADGRSSPVCPLDLSRSLSSHKHCRRASNPSHLFQGYNVLSLGQHLDDLAESFVMSAFYNGKLRTMKANYTLSLSI